MGKLPSKVPEEPKAGDLIAGLLSLISTKKPRQNGFHGGLMLSTGKKKDFPVGASKSD